MTAQKRQNAQKQALFLKYPLLLHWVQVEEKNKNKINIQTIMWTRVFKAHRMTIKYLQYSPYCK